MKARFEAAARDAGLRAEWVLDDANPWPVSRKVLEQARAVDLVVALQAEDDLVYSVMGEGPQGLALQSGRPVLVVPNKGEPVSFGRCVLIAWNGRREAARAAFDAMPFLTAAQHVRVLWVSPDDRGAAPADVPAADLATALARHHVRCEAAEARCLEAGAGATLLAYGRDIGADLLVMGCYGHSRLRELVLGGATRHVLENMTLPVLMSH
jgi:nucleotide-binding universal stress UspA family protein